MPADSRSTRATAPLQVHVSRGVRRAVPATGLLTRWARLAAAGRVRRRAELAVRIVGTAEGREFNRRFRGRRYATNVLSFGAPVAARGGPRLLGDLVICAPVVMREAREQRKNPQAHWAHMVIHGVLHLLGFDHERSADARRMERREVRLLRSLGFADPYGESRA